MIGLLFLGFITFWFVGSVWLARQLTSHLPSGVARTAPLWALVAASVALPLSDEIVGGFQFRALCKQNAVPTVDAEKTRGRNVRVKTDPANKEVDGTWVRVLHSHSSYRDAETNEELFSSHRYVANGGWLIRALSTDQHTTPLTFESTCDTTPSRDLGLKLVK